MKDPNDKAMELVEKFKPLVTTWDCYFDAQANPDEIVDAKKCAHIAVDEILSLNGFLCPQKDWSNNNAYWQAVKSAIDLIE